MENNSWSHLLFFQPHWDHTGNLAFSTMTWEACQRCLNKMKFKILKYWSFENSTLDSNKLSPPKKRKFFSFFHAVLHLLKRVYQCLNQKFVIHWSSTWNGIKVRLQVNNVGRGTDISIHVDTNFKFLLLWIQNTFSKVVTKNKPKKL